MFEPRQRGCHLANKKYGVCTAEVRAQMTAEEHLVVLQMVRALGVTSASNVLRIALQRLHEQLQEERPPDDKRNVA